MKAVSVTLLYLLLASPQVMGQIYKWTDNNGRVHYSDKPNPSAIQAPPSRNKPLFDSKSKPTKQASKISTSKYQKNILTLRKMLKNRQYQQLNTKILNLSTAYKSGTISEDNYMTAFEAFRINDLSYAKAFEEWVKLFPNSYQAYLSKGIYEYATGWFIRGNSWSSELKEDKATKFKRYLYDATENLEISLHLNSKSLVTYYYLLNAAISRGFESATENYYRKALYVDNSSYTIRSSYLKSLTPKWGGSIKKLTHYLSEAKNDIENYPKLRSLKGFIYTEVGNINAIDGVYTGAVDNYTTALEFGAHHDTLFKRGKNLYRTDQFDKALKDLSDAIAINPEKPDYYYWRSLTYIEKDDYESAMSDINKAYKLDPFDSSIRKKRNWLALRAPNQHHDKIAIEEAKSNILNLNQSIKETPYESQLYYKRANQYYLSSQLNLAAADIKQAILLNPNEYNYYLLLDHIYFKLGDFDQIIKYWKHYIQKHPKDGRAYNELSGTYSHTGDMKSTLKYAKMASDLGDPDGIISYQEWQKIINNRGQ